MKYAIKNVETNELLNGFTTADWVRVGIKPKTTKRKDLALYFSCKEDAKSVLEKFKEKDKKVYTLVEERKG